MNDTADNLVRQAEELEALNSIYGDEWQQDGATNNAFRIILKADSLCLELSINLPENYPGQSPPIFHILAPALKRQEMVEITGLLQEVYLENVGETVIFQWIEKAREWLQDKMETSLSDDSSHLQLEEANNQIHGNVWNYNIPSKLQLTEQGTYTQVGNPDIVHGEPVSFKKSTFQGHAAIVKNVDQIKAVLSELKENKKIANATHNMYAYRILKEDTKCICQDCEDDGEAQAGGRLLHLLQIMDVQNVLVVVSRWYGGVHLGPDRFRMINNSARQVIEKAGLLPSSDQKKKSK